MSTATAILIAAAALIVANLWGWYVAFPWQMRWVRREQMMRFPWTLDELKKEDEK